MKPKLYKAVAGLAIFVASSMEAQEKNYEEDWDSLSRHPATPEWFRDAKFGIYFHWGVYSVPAHASEWYASRMHYLTSEVGQYHLEKYGPVSTFGYHDFVPRFKAEHFDAEKWVTLFEKAGARFAGPVAEHHDGFAMWDSAATPWDSVGMGPKRDITGEIAAAVKRRGMKLITTFHHARNLQRYAPVPASDGDKVVDRDRFDSHFPNIEGTPPASEDPILKYLYGNIPEPQWLEEVWFAKLKEVIDQYQPDIMWFDAWLDSIPESYRKKFSAYYLNEAAKRHQDVVIVRKQEDLPASFSIIDLEKSRMNDIRSDPWMTDETVSLGSWCYTEGLQIKSAQDVLHVLVDIVSKNGVLLLNVSPKADGTIPSDQQAVLLEIGKWLGSNGEAIYGTRPWYAFGEGPTVQPEGHFDNRKEFLKIKYTYRDVRYTTTGNAIYATTLGVPDSKEVVLTAFAESKLPKLVTIDSVTVLGTKQSVDWSLTDRGLVLAVPDNLPAALATTFKVATR